LIFFLLILRPLPRSTLFPYTTLFRSSSILAAADKSTAARKRGFCGQSVRSNARFAASMAAWHSASPPSGTRPTDSPPAGLVVSRSEEHTSELQSRGHLVCRLLLEKKK